MALLQATNKTAPERAYLWLRDLIVRTPWDQEAFLSENAIAEASKISRTPVREALLRLEAEGLLRRIPHKGAFIPALTSDDIDEIMEVREVIGTWATRKVARESPYIAETLNELVVELSKHQDDPAAFIEIDIAFHKAIVRAGRNAALEQVYNSQYFKQARLGVQALLSTPERSSAVIEEHQKLVEAIKAQDLDLAVQANCEHLNSTRRILEARQDS